jgi:Flp pilus assembly protein TadB
MLRNADASPVTLRTGTLLRENPEVGGLTEILGRFSFTEKLDLIIEQSGQKTSSSKLILLSIFAAVFGFVLGSRFSFLPSGLTGIVAASVASCLPLLHLLHKRRKNFDEFEKQRLWTFSLVQ